MREPFETCDDYSLRKVLNCLYCSKNKQTEHLVKMKDYDFEYTNQRLIYALFLGLFVIIAISAIILMRLFEKFLLLDTIFSIVLGVAFFLFNKHRIRKVGKARLSDNEVVLELQDIRQIDFDQLKYYYLYNGKNGIVFTLGLIDGTKFKMSVNNNFCDIEPFEAFLADFGQAVETYKNQNQADIIHLESMLARKNAIYVLLLLTALVIIGYIFTRMPLMCIPIGFTLPVMVNWIQYFRLKQANKIVNF